MWLSPDFSLKAQQQISYYHNCKKDLKEASGTRLPCLSLFCKDEGGDWEALAVRKSLKKMSRKWAHHDVDEGPPLFSFSFCLISILMREVRIGPGVGAPPSDGGAPYPPRVVGLAQVVGGAGGGGCVRSRGAFGAHEADARQRVGRAGEGEGAVQAAGPDGAAERSGGPQAAGVAEDLLTKHNTTGSVRLKGGRQVVKRRWLC